MCVVISTCTSGMPSSMQTTNVWSVQYSEILVWSEHEETSGQLKFESCQLLSLVSPVFAKQSFPSATCRSGRDFMLSSSSFKILLGVVTFPSNKKTASVKHLQLKMLNLNIYLVTELKQCPVHYIWVSRCDFLFFRYQYFWFDPKTTTIVTHAIVTL